MWMMLQVLAPRVKDRGDSDPCPQVLAVARDTDQGFGSDFQQQSVEFCLVLVSNRTQRSWKLEHQMKVRDRQKLCFPRRKPGLCGPPLALGTVPIPTTVVRYPGAPTVFAALDVTPEGGCAATFDRRHYASLDEVQMSSVGGAPRLAVPAKDICYF
jgi:hypothetical protein